MGKPVQEAVLDTPIPKQADIVTEPARGVINPATGRAESILKTGSDPTQMIAQPLSEAVNPVIVDAAAGGDGSERAPVGTVTDTPGRS